MRFKKKRHCEARVKLDPNGNFAGNENQHTDAPSQTNCEVAKVTAEIKRRATEL